MGAEDFHEEYRGIFNTLATRYLVNDYVTERTKVLFILESPHVQELKYGAPVSGSSGASMSRHLFGERYAHLPLGLIVKKNVDEALRRPSIDRVGLMNVCQIPLQAAAYADATLTARHAEFFSALATVRTAGGTSAFTDPRKHAVQQIITGSIRRKLAKLQGQELFLVPCGRFAQSFFRLAAVTSPLWHVIDQVPHPSYNNWSKPQYAAAVERVKQVCADRVPMQP